MGYLLLYSSMEFLNFFALYKYVLKADFTTDKKVYAATFLSVFLCQAVLYGTFGDRYCDCLIIVAGFGIPQFWIKKDKSRMALFFPIVYLISALLNVFGAFLIALFVRVQLTYVIESEQYTLLAECTAFIFAYFYGVCKKNKERWNVKMIQYCALLAGLLCIIFIIAFLQRLDDGGEVSSKAVPLVGVSFVLFAFLFVVLSIWQTVTWSRAHQYQLKNAAYEAYLYRQEEYIQLLIDHDEKMRRFWHDINAHFVAMDGMLKEKKMEELQQYLYIVNEKLNESRVQKFTGIAAIDSVVSVYARKAKEQNILWEWHGGLCLSEQVSIFSLCTVFSNLLSNAVEACEKIEGERQIKVHVRSMDDIIYLKVSNTVEKEFVKENLKNTSKEDGRNHGFGLKNVEDIIEKGKGKIEFHVENGWFEVEILL